MTVMLLIWSQLAKQNILTTGIHHLYDPAQLPFQANDNAHQSLQLRASMQFTLHMQPLVALSEHIC